MSYRIGIDVGGTFTDLFCWSPSGDAQSFKVLSTPEDPSLGVLEGIGLMASAEGLSAEDFAAKISLIVHGTTVTTNATLTRGGARTGLVTTTGIRDALEMRRGIRERQYDNQYENVRPLVPRHRRLAVGGRLDSKGRVVEPIDEDAVREAAAAFRSDGVEAVAVCFMHAYANGEHEQEVARILKEELPDTWLSLSSEILPTIRFYERVSTTALNAYVGPVLRDYLASLTERVASVGFAGVLLIMQSNGGVALPEIVRERPATTLLSGPAAGPRAAATYATDQGSGDCLLVDMGGTSFDASLVRGGGADLSSEGKIDRLRIALPMLEIATIGAGGGSIGWIDAGGLLRMGPESAGALPGPVSYGRGGTRPTCTDTDVVLGYLDPAQFAGGKLPLDREAARAAIEAQIAAPLGLDVEEAAAGMYSVINANMAHGVREITVKRGVDPREFPMVVAGGAGALHASAIADELEIPTLIIPRTASTLCATGMLLSDLQHDFVRSCMGTLSDIDRDHLNLLAQEMMDEGEMHLKKEGAREIDHQISMDLRYLRQYHEVTVPIEPEDLRRGDIDRMAAALHGAHDQLYGYNLEEAGTPLELINIRVRSMGRGDGIELPRLDRGSSDAGHALRGSRRAWVFDRSRFEDVRIYDGQSLLAGNEIPGPALIERTDTTIFVSANFHAHVDDLGSVILNATEASDD